MDTAPERLALAEAFLQEAVYQSRAKQAAGSALAGLSGTISADSKASSPGTGSDTRRCGLGLRAEIVLDLSARAIEIGRQLWPSGLPETELDRIQAVLRDWIELQDALDRKRNHFLKAFRQAHGFDRHAYPPELRAEFEAGLERVNAEVTERRRASAAALLGVRA
jgi:hypothetical protein